MAPGDIETLDNILNQILFLDIHALNNTLRNAIPNDMRDPILAGVLADGRDPLSVLDMSANTLGALYILSARFNVSGAEPPSWDTINDFCSHFIPVQAHLAPERVTLLARGIKSLASFSNNATLALQPLYNLVTRYPPNQSILTTVHPIFVLTCASTRYFSLALPVLQHPITTIDTSLSDLHYNDNLQYHYVGGIIFAALRHWDEAAEFFEICVTSPGTALAAIQFEALKKLRLVQLIAYGKILPLPKYFNSILGRMFKTTPYTTFINAYPHDVKIQFDILERENMVFAIDKNTGLVQQAMARAPRWLLKKLTETYATLDLTHISQKIGLPSNEDVRSLLLNMIEDDEISAKISADGTVEFSDLPVHFSGVDVENVLREVRLQTATLAALDESLGRNKDFLHKAVKTREEPPWSTVGEEEVFSTSSGWEENMFT